MKTNKIIFWTLTIIFSGMLGLSGIMYLTHNPMIVQAFQKLGFPAFMLNLLGTAKLIGVVSLVQNRFATLKEWAYAGFTINLIGAAWTHIAAGESLVMLLVLFLVLAGSYYFWKKIQFAAVESGTQHATKYAL